MSRPDVSNEEKGRIRKAYQDRKTIRVPLTLGTNPRVVVLDPKWNTRGITYQEIFSDASASAEVQLAHMKYRCEYLNYFCDDLVGKPREWVFSVDNQNIYDAAYFGCPINFRDGQVPDATAILDTGDKERIFQMDIDHPLDNPFIKMMLKRYDGLKAAVSHLPSDGVEFKVAPPMIGFDGPLTIATCLRGTDLFYDIIEDPQYVTRLMEFITRGVMNRTRALGKLLGQKVFDGPNGNLADDSIQLISTDTFKELVLPIHRLWYSQWGNGPHFIHLCGDSTRHYPILHDELNVCAFDTGFPVDHGPLRKILGNDVEIAGGVEVAMLMGSAPQQVYQRAKGILQSGVMAGGRFILREGNNLPPCCPAENLQAMYQCCLDYGWYDAKANKQ